MKIYFARHGQSKGNIGDKFNGINETGLTKKGIQQAKKMGLTLKSEGITKIYCSSLKRAMQTAKIISETIEAPIEKSDFLQEMDFGVLEGLTKKYAGKKYTEILRERERNRFKFVVPKGESYETAQKRVSKILPKLKKHKNEKILIVAHDCINRCLMGRILKEKPIWVLGIKQPHEYIYCIDTNKKNIYNIWIEDKSFRKGFIS